MQTNTLPQNHMEIYWHDYASQMENINIRSASLTEKASIIGRTGLMLLSCGTGAWRVRSSMNSLAEQLNIPLSTLNGYMTGRRAFPLEILRDIAVVLQVTTDYLLGVSSSAEQPMELKHSEEELIKAYRGLKKDQRELIYQNIQFMKQQNQR